MNDLKKKKRTVSRSNQNKSTLTPKQQKAILVLIHFHLLVVLRKMLPKERPLYLKLLWGVNSEQKNFVLQENESRDINVSLHIFILFSNPHLFQWNNFSATELTNFLTMMNKEEENHLAAIRSKYYNYKNDLIKLIKAKGG